MAWIVVSQSETTLARTPPEVTEYVVEITVTDAGAIPRELFVYDTSTEEFSSVALVRDIESWPASKEAAIAAELDFYRDTKVRRSFSVKETAATFAADVRRRLEAVNRDYAGQAGVVFGGQQIFVYSTESP